MPKRHDKRPLCGAKKRQGEGNCTRPAGWGTPNAVGPCKLHGGNTRNGIQHARRVMAEDAARTFGLEVETTAEDALLGLLWRSLGTVMFYRERVRKLTDDQMVYGTERITRTARAAPGAPGAAQTVEDVTVAKSIKNVWVVLLQEAEAHHLKVAATVASLNIEHRRVQMAKEQGNLFYEVLQGVVERLGISRDDERLITIIPQVVAELTG